ncbi:MAG TPA: hypothetical protein VMM78_17580 [Thermomicrobiales bacterium]|nr:hypothetical protein [Thermomicrobiales bacterium]
MVEPAQRSLRRTDLIAAAIFIAAAVVAGLLGYRAITGFLGLTDDLTRVVVPGATEITFTETGDYTIFYEHRSTHDGRVFRTPQTLEGLRVSLLSRDTDSFVPLSPPGSDVEYSMRGRSGYAVLGFSIGEPGPYEITGFYEGNAQGPDVVLAIGQGVGRTLVVSILAGIGAAVILLLGVAAALALILVPRSRRKRQALQAPPIAASAPNS